MNSKDRRIERRHKIGVCATVITSGTCIPVYARDINVHGIRVESTDPIPTENTIAVTLPFLEDIILSGSVLWALDCHRQGKPYYQTGIEISAIILKDSEAISFPQKAALIKKILDRINKR